MVLARREPPPYTRPTPIEVPIPTDTMFKLLPARLALLSLFAAPWGIHTAAAQQTQPQTQQDLEVDALGSECTAKAVGASCTAYGLILQNGVSRLGRDEAEAVRKFSRACDLRHAPGCTAMALALQSGRGAAVDLAKARAAYTQACGGGDGPGCAGAGRMVLRGQGGDADVSQGLTLLNRGCDLKSGPACGSLGQHFGGAPPADAAKAAEFYGRACNLGQRMLCGERDRLASLVVPTPRITVEDVAAASATGAARPDVRFQAGCAARNGDACTQIGLMLMNGTPNVPKDETAAVASFRLACDLSHGAGCRALGMALQAGRGAAMNLPQAHAEYQKACRANDGPGCGRAGYLYLTGQAGPKDLPQGLDLLSRGCDLRDNVSCNTLGTFYASVPPIDTTKAALYFGKACSLGLGTACANRDRLTAATPR